MGRSWGAGGGGRAVSLGGGTGDPAEQHPHQALHAGGGAAGPADQQEQNNTEGHRRLWKHNDEQDATLNDHETRITILERKD